MHNNIIKLVKIYKMTTQAKSNRPERPDYTVKSITIGDKSVGKSSCIERFFSGEYSDSNMATLGVASKSKTVEMEGKKVKL